VEAGSNTYTVALRVVGGDKEGSLESETVKYGRQSHGTRTREWMRWRGPAAIVNHRPILSWERMLYKDYDRRCSIEKRNSGRESQGARRQDGLIEGKPPVVKQLWLTNSDRFETETVNLRQLKPLWSNSDSGSDSLNDSVVVNRKGVVARDLSLVNRKWPIRKSEPSQSQWKRRPS
jgi:hypothetical protein